MAHGCGRSEPETPGRDARPPGRPGCDCIRPDSWSIDSETRCAYARRSRVQSKTGVDSTLADLAQSPYSPGLGQGVRDGCQACNVGDGRKAVPLFGKSDARLAGDVFVTVQYHLGGERRMPADLDSQMAPVGVEDVERIVVDIGASCRNAEIGWFCEAGASSQARSGQGLELKRRTSASAARAATPNIRWQNALA